MSLPQFAVFGHPIAHSLSPRIHARFGAQMGIPLHYASIDAPPETFAAQLADFARADGTAANVTLPLKQLAATQCAELSDFATRAGAVNTLTRLADGRWRGDNTDGDGLVRDLTERHALDLRGRRGLVLGAGGAARAAVFALLDAGVAELVIVNRTPERADVLADAVGEPARVTTRYWEDLGACGNFELIINATSAGHDRSTLDLPFAPVAPRVRARHWMAWACSSSRRPKRSPSGTACARKPIPCSRNCAKNFRYARRTKD